MKKTTRLSILAASATTSALATHFLIYNSDTIMLDLLTTPMIVYLIRTPEYRWYAFRNVDDEDNTMKCHRGLSALGALLSENAIATIVTTLSLAVLPTSMKKKFIIDKAVFPLVDRVNRFSFKVVNKIKASTEKFLGDDGSRVAKTAIVGAVLGSSLYHATVVLPYGTYKHVCLAVFQNFLNKVAPELPENPMVDRVGAGALFAAFGYLTWSFGKLLKDKLLEQEQQQQDISSENKTKFTLNDMKRFVLEDF